MNQTLKAVVDGVIKNEFNYIQSGELKDMKDINEFDQLGKKCSELQHILSDHLPTELQDLLDEFECKHTELFCLEIRYYFRKGVMAGLTNLDFLKEIKGIEYIDIL